MPLTKVLLVSPNRFKEPYPVYPLALSYLKSSLQKQFSDLCVELFDFNLNDENAFTNRLIDFQPDLVGISIRNIDTVNIFHETHFVQESRDLITQVKKHVNAFIVIGGAGFSIFPEAIFQLIQPDYGIFGEGEESFCQLVRALKNKETVSQIDGLLFQVDGQLIFNKRKAYCSDPELVFDDDLVDFYWETAGMLNVQTKRGCPYHCLYCTYPLIDGTKVRTRSPAKVVDSIKTLYQSKGITYFFFTDSVFNIHNDYNVELAERLIASNLNIQWGAYFTPHRLEPGLLSLFKKSGLTHLEFGTESLSNSTLKAYNKAFSIKDILQTARLCKEHRLYTAHFLILGGPGESEQSIEETIQNSNRMEKTVFFPFFGMRIYPNTGVYEQAIAEGKIARDASMLPATYYLADKIDYDAIKAKAKATSNRWIFPDENLQKPMAITRKRGVKGPLWELLIK